MTIMRERARDDARVSINAGSDRDAPMLGSAPAGTVPRMLLKNIALERMAERLHRLNDVAGRPLLGRVGHLRGLDFPTPRPRGAGTKQPLGLDDALKLLTAFELMDAGLGTAQIASFLQREWSGVRRLLAHGWARDRRPKRDAPPRRYLAIQAANLSRYGDGSTDKEDPPLDLVGTPDPEQVREHLEEGLPGRNLILLDLERFIVAVGAAVVPSDAGTLEQFEAEMSLMCREAFGTDDETAWRIVDHDELSTIPVRARR